MTRNLLTGLAGIALVAASAGDMIAEITLAMQHGIGLKKIAGTIHPLPVEVVERPDANPADVPAIALSEALVRARALDAGLAYELVAARNDLAQVVAAVRRGQPEPPVRTLQGWRRDLVGAELLELLAGRRSLAVDPSGRVRISSG